MGTSHEQGKETPCVWVAVVPAFWERDLRALVCDGGYSIKSNREQTFLPHAKLMGICSDGPHTMKGTLKGF